MRTAYNRMTKAQLIAILDPEMGIEQTLSWSRSSKAKIIAAIRRQIARESAASRRPCPKGHKPGDPECDLTCHLTGIVPMDSPFLEQAPKVKNRHELHEWLNDDLFPVPTTPVPESAELTGLAATGGALSDVYADPDDRAAETARDFITHTYGHNEAGELVRLMTNHIATDHVNWQKFVEHFHALMRQFSEPPKRHWWERIPDAWGWWWRVPYGWLLAQKRHLHNAMVGWRVSRSYPTDGEGRSR